MITIRDYQESDAVQVGNLIAETYSEFNLGFASPEELPRLLGPFQHARSSEPAHKALIAQTIRSEIVLVAEIGDKIVGVLRGRKERLGSLFVDKDYHRQGIAHILVEHFEQERMAQGDAFIRVAATLYAMPFYAAQGYKKNTGLRNGWSFEGQGLRYQPMKKTLI